MFQLSKLTPQQHAAAVNLGGTATSASGVRFDTTPAATVLVIEAAIAVQASQGIQGSTSADSAMLTLNSLRNRVLNLVPGPGAVTVTAPVVITEDGSPRLNVLSVQYGYFAHDAGGNIITRDDLTAEQLRIQEGNLIVSGYHVSPGRTDGCDTCGYVPATEPQATAAAPQAKAAKLVPGTVVRERKARATGNWTTVTYEGPGEWVLHVNCPDGASAGSRTFATRAAAVQQARQGVIG